MHPIGGFRADLHPDDAVRKTGLWPTTHMTIDGIKYPFGLIYLTNENIGCKFFQILFIRPATSYLKFKAQVHRECKKKYNKFVSMVSW